MLISSINLPFNLSSFLEIFLNPLNSKSEISSTCFKRLLIALKDNIDKFEKTFGPVKQTDEPPRFPVNFGGTIGEA